eukprot:12611174-Alexandrium_andersonii.AAC.1
MPGLCACVLAPCDASRRLRRPRLHRCRAPRRRVNREGLARRLVVGELVVEAGVVLEASHPPLVPYA